MQRFLFLLGRQGNQGNLFLSKQGTRKSNRPEKRIMKSTRASIGGPKPPTTSSIARHSEFPFFPFFVGLICR